MAIAKLSRVMLISSKSDLGSLLTHLFQFGNFHPSERSDFTDDPELLLLGSRAHHVYSQSSELLGAKGVVAERMTERREAFMAKDLKNLVDLLGSRLAEIERRLEELADTAKESMIYQQLTVLNETALITFNNIRRFRVYPGLKLFVILEGFVPSSLLNDFRDQLEGYILSVEPADPRSHREPYVPSLITNPRVVSLFQDIALAQGVPKYGEIDPTPIIAFVFPIFFGIMFADLGHGIALLALGLWLVVRGRGRRRYWGRVLLVLGCSASIAGLFTGVIFGLDFPSPLRGLIPLTNLVSGIPSVSTALLMLGLAMIIGTFHLASAYAIATINQLRLRNFVDALLIHLPTLTFYSSAIPFALAVIGVGFEWNEIFISNLATPGFKEFLGLHVPASFTAGISVPLALASFLILLAGRPVTFLMQGRKRHLVLEALGEGLLKGLLTPIEFLSNTVSYARLGAVLIIGIVLGSMITEVLKLGIIGIPLAILLNLGLIALEALIVYIQDLRLHLYEWLTKFSSGLGSPFTPLISRGEGGEVVWSSGKG